MPNLFGSLQQRAQAAIDKSGIGAKIPGMTHTTAAQQPLDEHGNPVQAPQSAPSTNNPDGRGSKPFMLESLTQQFKQLHNQYSPQGPPEVRLLQILITNAKGIKLDYEGVARDTKALSKDFYLWGQDQEEDVKDVSDRLAFINFTQGMLTATLSDKIDESRAPLKKLREAQVSMAPRKAARANIETQIRNINANPSKVTDAQHRIQELNSQLQKNIADDAPLEKEIGEVKRRAVRESELAKWAAVKEYAEKLLLLSETANRIIDQLPAAPPTAQQPYRGQNATASARTALQTALDQYKPGMTSLPGGPTMGGGNIDSRSFGESHASELSRVPSMASGIQHPSAAASAIPTGGAPTEQSYPPTGYPASSYSISASPPAMSSMDHHVGGFAVERQGSHPVPAPLNPAALNNAPAPIPSVPSATSSSAGPNVLSPAVSSAVATEGHSVDTPSGSAAPAHPTVAETGLPLSAGAGGPGPASGSLSRDNDIPAYHDAPGGGIGGFRSDTLKHESAEDEKKRLEREERERLLGTSGAGAQPPYETAEDEKKRLEREERERILRGDDSHPTQQPPSGTPPPYTGS